MILTGNEIVRLVRKRKIIISPFNEKRVNPNSYNYSLGKFYRTVDYDENGNCLPSELKKIPQTGLTLYPGKVYLASTEEQIGSSSYVVSLIGRSSVGRLGLFVQYSADLGNLGSAHCWTLELKCVQPIIVYPGMIMGQVSFWKTKGKRKIYSGLYTHFDTPEGKQYDIDGK